MRLHGVGMRYGLGQPWVVQDVTLHVRPGALIRLEGKNGAGKSTLLRVIAGVTAPSKGTITGRPVTGYVPERFPAALPFPARSYLTHMGRVFGLASGDLPKRIEACLDRLGGAELGDIPMRRMSKGMCQKVAIAQALLPGTGLLVLDEAWTGLDAQARAALDGVVAERLADGGSVVYVDHDQSRLASLAAERWLLDQGQASLVGAGVSGAGGDGVKPSADDAGGRREPQGRGGAWTEGAKSSDEGRRRLMAPRRRTGDTA